MVANLPLLFHLMSSFLLVSTLGQLSVRAQELRSRVLRRAPVEAGHKSPIQIISVSLKGEALEPGGQFFANDDWFLRLTFRVKNVSDRPISYLAISLRVRPEANEFIGPYQFGCPPIFKCYPEGGRPRQAIMPGVTRDVTVEEGKYDYLTSLFSQDGERPIIAAEYDVNQVFFDADTMWIRGVLFKRDHVESNTYRRVGKYELPKQAE